MPTKGEPGSCFEPGILQVQVTWESLLSDGKGFAIWRRIQVHSSAPFLYLGIAYFTFWTCNWQILGPPCQAQAKPRQAQAASEASRGI